MSFNLLKLKKNADIEISFTTMEIDWLIVGFSPLSIFECTIDNTIDSKKVLVLDVAERTIEEHLNIADALPYPWFTKEQNSIPHSQGIKFYKDGELRLFNSRHKLNSCHSYLMNYQHPRTMLSWQKWWSAVIPFTIKEQLQNSMMFGQVKTLNYKNDKWEIETFDHKKIIAKRMTWNLAPNLFLKLFHYEGQYPKKFLDYCASLTGLNFLLQQILIDKNIKGETELESCLVPLTMGTDEGYFMVTKNSHEKHDVINILYAFNESEISEDMVAQKIKLIKKQLKKIFNVSEQQLSNDKVWFLPNYTFVSSLNALLAAPTFLQDSTIFSFDDGFSFSNKLNNSKTTDEMIKVFMESMTFNDEQSI